MLESSERWPWTRQGRDKGQCSLLRVHVQPMTSKRWEHRQSVQFTSAWPPGTYSTTVDTILGRIDQPSHLAWFISKFSEHPQIEKEGDCCQIVNQESTGLRNI